MITLPKLVLLLVIGFAVWYAMRWVNRAVPPRPLRRQPQPSPRQTPAVEDLTACRTCGAYVAAGARACGKAGCPLPG